MMFRDVLCLAARWVRSELSHWSTHELVITLISMIGIFTLIIIALGG